MCVRATLEYPMLVPLKLGVRTLNNFWQCHHFGKHALFVFKSSFVHLELAKIRCKRIDVGTQTHERTGKQFLGNRLHQLDPFLDQVRQFFRIGHEKYKKLYGTDGALTLTKDHIRKKDDKIHIEFLGKKKEVNYCLLDDKESQLYKILDRFLSKNQKDLFKNIKYNDVYNMINKYKLKPKDIRQVGANRQFYSNLKRMRLKCLKEQKSL